MPKIMRRIVDAAQLAVAWRLFDSGELPAVSLDTVLSREAGGRTAWKVRER
jgi:hypothetical protein